MQQTPVQEELVKLQPKGLITIPKKMREFLNLEEKSIMRLRLEKGRLYLEPLKTLSYPVRTYSKEEIKEFLAFDAKETKQLKKKKLLK
ncbi:AbrB/MazE/SpoVT family DNA-binding domain-containing protein [Candidatus Roizmanbacteria bacterium]|nr:AbrB/MazE/SpoVT family DNA-binding domain-containing protein [Candidatus Roizmanbacteria bacterium]